MLLWISIGLLIVGIIIVVIDVSSDFITTISTISILSSGVIAISMLIIMIVNLITIDAQVEAWNMYYESLIYKAETEAIRDELGVINKDYINEIQDWNMDLAYRKEMQDNFWVGIAIPDVYDQFEFIDLEQIKFKE